MKNHRFPLFAGLHTAIATVLALSSASQAQNLYWDTNGTAADFGGFGGSWNGTTTNFNSDATGGAGGTLSAVTSSANNLIFSGGGATGIIILTGNQTVASIDFANTANNAVLQVGAQTSDPRSLTVTGAIKDTGAGLGEIRVLNLTSSAAASVLVASSITANILNFAEDLFTNAQFFSTGYDITLATQFTLGRGNGNFTYTQTGGNVTVNDTTRGINFNAGDLSNATSSTRAHTYNLNGGELRVGRIGVNTPNNGNNGTGNAYSSNARLEFNSGTIRNSTANGSLLFQNGIAFKDYNGSGTKDMQYNTHLPLTVALSQTGTHTVHADGASSSIIVTPGAQFVNKTSEAGTLTKSGLGTLVFTGGGPVAVNSYTGSTTVTAGTVSTDYNRIAGQAATGGINNLNNGYSAGSQLILDGGNYSLVGRGSAIAGSATGVTLNAGVAGMQVNVGSTANLV
ncbi:MAG: autotransporter-associated beta strand repeat-containing protein, partial [Luteolibacter sp.]